jgi:hypothetical protein
MLWISHENQLALGNTAKLTVDWLEVQNAGSKFSLSQGAQLHTNYFTNDGIVNDSGTIIINKLLQNRGNITGDGSIDVNGSINNYKGATLDIGSIQVKGHVENDGTLYITNGGDFNGGYSGSGGLSDFSGVLKINGVANGTAALANSAELDLLGSATGKSHLTVLMYGDTSLVLDHSANFAGAVSGKHGNSIDVLDVGFNIAHDSYDSGAGKLTVGDGTHTAQINIIGSASFSFQTDGHGGTLITFA